MATVWIPPLVQGLTGGRQVVEAPGTTLREVIDNLDAEYPGLKGRLFENGRVRPGISVTVDGVVSNKRNRSVREDSEIHFVPAISGG
jgi:molybdopterin converting factor small subunit